MPSYPCHGLPRIHHIARSNPGHRFCNTQPVLGRIFVLSRLKSCMHSTSQISEMSGTYRSNCLLVSSGSSPLSPISEAIVPPVPMRSIRFFPMMQMISFLHMVMHLYIRLQFYFSSSPCY